MKYIIGKKIGMTQVFGENGSITPITVIQCYPLTVTAVKTKEEFGYDAIQVGWCETKPGKLNKPQRGYFEKNKLPYFKYLKEFRILNPGEFKVGSKITCEIFKKGEYVDVIGKSKGRGFAGVVKRHGFSGGPASHGSMIYRRPMAIGSTDAARVIKGKRMPGHYGAERVTVQNLKIAEVDKENNIIAVSGSVPGPNKGEVIIRKAIKKGN